MGERIYIRQRYCCTHIELLDDMGHVQETRLQDRREELYMVPVEVQGFEGLVVEGMQQLPSTFDKSAPTHKSAYSPARLECRMTQGMHGR